MSVNGYIEIGESTDIDHINLGTLIAGSTLRKKETNSSVHTDK